MQRTKKQVRRPGCYEKDLEVVIQLAEAVVGAVRAMRAVWVVARVDADVAAVVDVHHTLGDTVVPAAGDRRDQGGVRAVARLDGDRDAGRAEQVEAVAVAGPAAVVALRAVGVALLPVDRAGAVLEAGAPRQALAAQLGLGDGVGLHMHTDRDVIETAVDCGGI